MKVTLALLAGGLALAGCTTIEDDTAAPRDTCQAEPGQRFIGQRATLETGAAIVEATNSTRLRVGNVGHEHAHAHDVSRVPAELADIFEDLLEAAFRLAARIGREAAVGLGTDVARHDDAVAHADRARELGLFLEP